MKAHLPVPLSRIFCGLPPALSATETFPLRVPTPAGVNEMLTAQLPPPATLLVQLFVWENSLVELTLEIKSAALPTSCTTTVCGGLVVPTAWGAKVKDAGVKLTPGALLGLIFATHTSLAPPA
jgi:hypothetical protein